MRQEKIVDKELKDFLDNRFSQVDGRFSQIDEKFVHVDGRFCQIDEKFVHVEGRFSQIDEKFHSLGIEMKSLEDRVLHQYHITAEALRDDIKQVAEGVMNLNEKFDREIYQFRKEVAYSHEELKSMIKFSYSELDRRLTTLEEELDNLKRRVEKIEKRSSTS
jgi:chromosome segregation ATPase